MSTRYGHLFPESKEKLRDGLYATFENATKDDTLCSFGVLGEESATAEASGEAVTAL